MKAPQYPYKPSHVFDPNNPLTHEKKVLEYQEQIDSLTQIEVKPRKWGGLLGAGLCLGVISCVVGGSAWMLEAEKMGASFLMSGSLAATLSSLTKIVLSYDASLAHLVKKEVDREKQELEKKIKHDPKNREDLKYVF